MADNYYIYQELESDVDKHRGIQLFLGRFGISCAVRTLVDQLARSSAWNAAGSCMPADSALGGTCGLSGGLEQPIFPYG
ncbi:MAG: hypothetical protein C0508_29725 [Cyanobacteria bacterium PR.023]|nr:hypothetical protein [Cyanobacteria bacterium PR.023]